MTWSWYTVGLSFIEKFTAVSSRGSGQLSMGCHDEYCSLAFLLLIRRYTKYPAIAMRPAENKPTITDRAVTTGSIVEAGTSITVGSPGGMVEVVDDVSICRGKFFDGRVPWEGAYVASSMVVVTVVVVVVEVVVVVDVVVEVVVVVYPWVARVTPASSKSKPETPKSYGLSAVDELFSKSTWDAKNGPTCTSDPSVKLVGT